MKLAIAVGGILLLAAAEARGQGLLDAAAAGAAAGEVGAGAAGALQRQAAAIRRGAEAAAQGGPFGRGANWVPGMPEPQAAQGAANGGGSGQAERRSGGLILYDQLRDPQADYEVAPRQEIPEQYIVAKGDTLWSLSERFFGNPWYWPKLWSYNEMITNPHWIYPGDLLSLVPPGQRTQKPAAPATDDKTQQAPRLSRSQPPLPTGIFLRQNGFVEPGELQVAGRIVGSKEEKIMLASLDEVYIETNPKNPLKVGERYTIYRVLKSVRRPYGQGESLGSVVEILGDVQVRQITPGGIARAVIREALGPIERGYRVGPLRRTFKLVDPKPNARALEGMLVESLVPSAMLGSQQLLFVDLGKRDGLEVGNRLFVIRRGDGYVKMLGSEPVDDKRFPKEIVAEILVVDVRDRISAGLITRSIRETRLGDRVEARKGY
ncbi:MAG: LysM peptidoglycan-binding domain-containing protein [Myxococcales bacterium]|nr:LysM peptidoglycan-binding domain-containing protein [Myxococcota bacterium]MDW8281111.1 LysM peptidoglycan-binding domain-containing protein [Myxococcales bacterium]